MEMEIGQDAARALSLCSTSSSPLSLQQLSDLARAAMAVLLDSLPEDAALSSVSLHPLSIDLIKNTYSALICLFLEASKNDLSVPQLSAFLTSDCSLQGNDAEDDRVRTLCSVFEENKAALRKLLSCLANHSSLSRVLGVDWKLDSSEEEEREFVYSVRFNTMDPATGAEGHVGFACSVEGLQDLVSRLKDACKAVERSIGR